jgi:superfamily II DNA or RNA helicase
MGGIDYSAFIQAKKLSRPALGIEWEREDLNPALFDFQKDAVLWAVKKGRSCLFADCGLGKTFQQLEWGRIINKITNAPVLIVAPLAVGKQTKAEGRKFGIATHLSSSQTEVINGINITNYEKLHKFDGSKFSGVVLDESSILKSFSGKIRNQIINMFSHTPYKLACTATPSPNDYIELGNHAEFVGALSYSEMLSMFFINDAQDGNQWRLRKHAGENAFWEWVCSWAVLISKPSDLGYNQVGFDLPPLNYVEHSLQGIPKNHKGLLVLEASTMEERREIRRETIQIRCEKAAQLVNNSNEAWVLWCGLNQESQLLTHLVEDAQEVSGSTDLELREQRLLDFASGKIKCLVTKPSIAGFGMNWQNCNKMAFVGLSDSWEQLYQATRRIWRYGQKRPVEVHLIIDQREGKVLRNIQRKDHQAQSMVKRMVQLTKELLKKELHGNKEEKPEENLSPMILPQWLQI